MTVLAWICVLIGLSSAVVGGVFLGFSDFIMRALLRSKPAAAIEVMQQVNVTVLRSIFLMMFLALTPACLALSVYAWNTESLTTDIWIHAGTIIYVIGSFLVTIAGNVPMNNRLASLDVTSEPAQVYWQTYGRRWTRLNTIRTVASILAAVCLVLAGSLAG